MTDPLANVTFYTVWTNDPDFVEPQGHVMMTQEAVRSFIYEMPDGHGLICVFQHDYDVARQDITEDLARAEYYKLRDDVGVDFVGDHLPSWLIEHMPSDLDSGARAE